MRVTSHSALFCGTFQKHGTGPATATSHFSHISNTTTLTSCLHTQALLSVVDVFSPNELEAASMVGQVRMCVAVQVLCITFDILLV